MVMYLSGVWTFIRRSFPVVLILVYYRPLLQPRRPFALGIGPLHHLQSSNAWSEAVVGTALTLTVGLLAGTGAIRRAGSSTSDFAWP
jgi:hypothetical protein